MTPEQQASLLADWLDGQPGAEPPEGLDLDVVEGVYALRPDLAPPPRVTVEDILAGVSADPVGKTPGLAESTVGAEVLPLPPRPLPMRRIWALVGSIAVAALALLVVMPVQDQAPSVGPAQELPSTADAKPEAAPAPDEPALPTGIGAAPKDAPAPRAKPPSAPRPNQPQVSEQWPPPAQTPTTASSPSSYGPSPLAEADLDLADKAASYDDNAEGGLASSAVGGVVQAEPQAASDELEAPRRKATEGKREERASTRGASASNVATPAPSAATTGASGGGSVANLSALRASATPGDYDPSWYTRADADTAARIGEIVTRAAQAGRSAQAVSIYAGGISDPNPQAGQDLAGRAARLALDLGDPASALRYAERGIQRSSSNTAFLARLYAIKGEALERQGNSEAAAAAYGYASQLNLSR